jgi:hypothetical protein
MAAKAAQDLEDILGELKKAADSNGAKVSVGELVDAVGRRSFGPLLVLGGLLGMTPVAAIPSVPSLIALITILISAQLLFGRDRVWLPRFLERLSVKAEKVQKAVRVARKPARMADRVVKPRLQALTEPVADRLVALACILLALAVPPLEFLPFVAFVPALAITAFGLALIARDGVLVLLAFAITAGAIGTLAWKFWPG